LVKGENVSWVPSVCSESPNIVPFWGETLLELNEVHGIQTSVLNNDHVFVFYSDIKRKDTIY